MQVRLNFHAHVKNQTPTNNIKFYKESSYIILFSCVRNVQRLNANHEIFFHVSRILF